MIENITLKNFTAFDDLTVNFSPKINVIIGENGTGKTQLLKAAYGLCVGANLCEKEPHPSLNQLESALTTKLRRLFMPIDDKLGKMHRQGTKGHAYLSLRFLDGQKITTTFSNRASKVTVEDVPEEDAVKINAVFIPTKEVLSLVRGMTDPSHDQKTVEMIFDGGYVDLAEKLMKKTPPDFEETLHQNPRLATVIPKLVNLIGGRYYWKEEGFCFQYGSYVTKPSPQRTDANSAKMYQDSTVLRFVPKNDHRYSSAMTAEGFRKIGTLHQLLSNGSIASQEGGVLFWDEPESNMNPKLMRLLVETLIELSRNGQQIILATHDYVLLKWFDLLADTGKGDHVRYHALYQDRNDNIQVESVDDYKGISQNAISETFNDLTKEQVNQKMGGLGK